jgi:hypothetical protein
MPAGYTVVEYANGSCPISGPQGGTYQSAGYHSADGYPIYKSSSGNYVTLENGNTPVPSPSAANGNSTIAQNYANGIQFQGAASKALDIAPNAKAIPVTMPDGTVVSTIPDGLSATAVTEIKSDAYLTSSSQLSAQMQLATQQGIPFNLVVGPNTVISGPLLDAVSELPSGSSIKIYNPGTGQLTPYLGKP